VTCFVVEQERVLKALSLAGTGESRARERRIVQDGKAPDCSPDPAGQGGNTSGAAVADQGKSLTRQAVGGPLGLIATAGCTAVEECEAVESGGRRVLRPASSSGCRRQCSRAMSRSAGAGWRDRCTLPGDRRVAGSDRPRGAKDLRVRGRTVAWSPRRGRGAAPLDTTDATALAQITALCASEPYSAPGRVTWSDGGGAHQPLRGLATAGAHGCPGPTRTGPARPAGAATEWSTRAGGAVFGGRARDLGKTGENARPGADLIVGQWGRYARAIRRQTCWTSTDGGKWTRNNADGDGLRRPAKRASARGAEANDSGLSGWGDTTARRWRPRRDGAGVRRAGYAPDSAPYQGSASGGPSSAVPAAGGGGGGEDLAQPTWSAGRCAPGRIPRAGPPAFPNGGWVEPDRFLLEAVTPWRSSASTARPGMGHRPPRLQPAGRRSPLGAHRRRRAVGRGGGHLLLATTGKAARALAALSAGYSTWTEGRRPSRCGCVRDVRRAARIRTTRYGVHETSCVAKPSRGESHHRGSRTSMVHAVEASCA